MIKWRNISGEWEGLAQPPGLLFTVYRQRGDWRVACANTGGMGEVGRIWGIAYPSAQAAMIACQEHAIAWTPHSWRKGINAAEGDARNVAV